MSEFIGSRISLISKSDIRYVGTLHEINSENSTVALEQVKSFGTEGRRGNPAEELAGSDSVYEYIVFRGSDVKDLRIEEAPKDAQPAPPPQVPNDPAILGSGSRPDAPHSQPPFQQHQQGPPYGQQQFNGGYPGQQRFGGPPGYQGGGPPGPPPNGFSGYPPMPYGPPPPGYYGPPGHGMQPPQGPFSPSQQMPYGAPGPHQQGGQRPPLQQNTAGPPTARPDSMPAAEIQEKETPDSAPKAKPAGGQKRGAGEGGAASANKGAPRPPVESKPDTAAATAAPKPVAASGINGGRKGKIVPVMPLAGGPVGPAEGGRPSQAAAKLQYQNATQAATAAVAAAMAKLPPAAGAEAGAGASGRRGAGDADEGLAHAVQDMRLDQRARNGGQHEFGSGHGRGRGGGTGGGSGGRRGGREAAKVVEVPKTDYDFESANAKFNKQDAGKGEGEGGVGEVGADGTGDVSIPAASAMYSKSSFFDNISSEAKDREEAADGQRRPSGNDFRTQERQRNMETFGMGSVDNRFSGHRGRGRGGRGGGGQRGRGGFRGRGALDVAP